MIQRRYLIAVTILLLSSSLEAENFKLLFLQGGENTSGLDMSYDTYLDKSKIWRIGVNYYSNKSATAKKFDLINKEGKIATEMDKMDMSAFLVYDFPFNLSFGVEYAQFKEDSEQWGYYKDKTDYLPYDHFVTLKGSKVSIKMISFYISDKFWIDLRASLTPKTKLDIEQNTEIYPNHIKGGHLKTKATIGSSYKIDTQMQWEVGNIVNVASVDFGIEGSYEFIPYEYEMMVKTKSGYTKKIAKYDEKRSEYFASLTFKDDKKFDGYGVSVKYGQTKIQRDNLKTVSENILKFGIEKWF